MMRLFIYIYIYIYVCMYVCIYNLIKIIYTYNLIDKILIKITNKYLQKLYIQSDIKN